MRVWHHHLTLLNIHKDWSRTVCQKYGKFQNVITSLFLIRFSWFLHHFVGIIFSLFMKGNLARMSSLTVQASIFMMCQTRKPSCNQPSKMQKRGYRPLIVRRYSNLATSITKYYRQQVLSPILPTETNWLPTSCAVSTQISN